MLKSRRNLDGFICLVTVPALQFEKFTCKCWKCKFESSKYLWVISKYHLAPPKTDERGKHKAVILVTDKASWAIKRNNPINWKKRRESVFWEAGGHDEESRALGVLASQGVHSFVYKWQRCCLAPGMSLWIQWVDDTEQVTPTECSPCARRESNTYSEFCISISMEHIAVLFDTWSWLLFSS